MDSTFRVFHKYSSFNVRLITPDTTAVVTKKELPALTSTFMFLRSKKWVESNADMEIRIYIDSVIVNDPEISISSTNAPGWHMDSRYYDQYQGTTSYHYLVSISFMLAETVAYRFRLPTPIERTISFDAGIIGGARYTNRVTDGKFNENEGVNRGEYSYYHNNRVSRSTADNVAKLFKQQFCRKIKIIIEDLELALKDYRREALKP